MALMEEDDGGGGVPEWVVTFGDMMSLLLTFFIMLVSMSEVKQHEKYQAMVDSMRRRFGHDAAIVSLVPGSAKPRNSVFAKLATMGRASRFNIMKGGDKVQAPVGDYPRVQIIRPGDKTAVGAVIHFAPGSSDLSAEGRDVLDQAVLQLEGKPQIIEVRGHTSRRPASASQEDNWQMAYRRSENVMRYLVDAKGIDARRIRLAVAGANEPLHQGAERQQLERNDRVEVFLLDEIVEDRGGVSLNVLTPESVPAGSSP
jgi:chemotaxis protein MotB